MDKKNTLMQAIRKAASGLKGCKLKNLQNLAPVFKSIGAETGTESEEEVIVFVAILDRQCGGRSSALNDISDYLECTSLDVMQFVPAIKSLIAKGIFTVENRSETLLMDKRFVLCPDIFYAVIEGRKIEPVEMTEEMTYDQFDFCEAVDKLKEDRSHGNIETRKFFICVEKMEAEHAQMPLVKELKVLTSDIESRTLFYEMCYDFASGDQSHKNAVTDIDLTLKHFYDRIVSRAEVKAALTKGAHPLVEANLIRCVGDDEAKLTRKGIMMLYGDKSDAVLDSTRVEDRYEFVKRIHKLVNNLPRNVEIQHRCELREEISLLEEDNAGFSFIAAAKKVLPDFVSRLIFYLTCNELVDGDTYSISCISEFCGSRESANIRSKLKEGSHPLVKKRLAEITGGGHFDGAQLQLTDKGKELFLEEDAGLFDEKTGGSGLIEPDKIDEKQLFFEKSLQEQLSMLRNSLAEDNYRNLCNRLSEKKLPKGVAILLYGRPGTGKTETALQIAKATGRAIMHVDISATKTCWFGESEKLIKGVFTRYRHLCEKSKIKPILLFNEADAVFSKRKDSNSSNVAQTENAIQNIILEEMEKLDGILIATTNLADNLDHAFERRFLFKIKYENPNIEAKTRIWKDKMPLLNDSEAEQLASAYDFSGGQIDNIVRKSLMEEVIKGKRPTLPSLMAICASEKIEGDTKGKIGF